MGCPKKKILIIDDDPQTTGFLKYRFDKAGYDIEVAESGEESLKKLHSYVPDAILLDLMMPAMDDGCEVLKAIKTDPDLKIRQTPVIMLTGHGNIASAVKCMKAGAEDYIEKPVDISVIFNSVQNAMENPQRRAYGTPH